VIAAVIPFTGSWQGEGRFERTSYQLNVESRALRDARLIREAKQEADNWLSMAFLAMLRVLSDEQRRLLEATLAIRAVTGDVEAEQALAIVRFRNGTPEHCGRVAEMLRRLNAEVGQ
jgi:hypothetical protein